MGLRRQAPPVLVTARLRPLEGGVPPLPRAHAGRGGDRGEEEFTVPDTAGLGGLADRVDHPIHPAVRDHDLDLDLRQHVHLIGLATAAHVNDPLLHTAAGDVDDVQAADADRRQGVLHVVQLLGSDNSFDLLHVSSRALRFGAPRPWHRRRGGGVADGRRGNGDRAGLVEDVAAFAVLGDVQPQLLLLVLHAQTHGDVEHLQDNRSDGEGVDPDNADGGQLIQHLAPFAVEEAVEATHGGDGEEAGGEGAPGAADPVHGHDVQGVVQAGAGAQTDGEVAEDAGDAADDDRLHGLDEAGGRGDGDQAGDGAGGGADDAGLARQQPTGEHPGQGGGSGGGVGDDEGVGGLAVGGAGATGGEAEPAEPEDRGAQNNGGDGGGVQGG